MSPVGSTGHTHVHPHSYMHVEHACAHSQRLLRPPEPCVWWGDSAPKCTVTRAVSPPVGDMVPSTWDAMVFNHTRGARLPPMTEFPQGTRRGHVHSCARCGATSPHLLRPRPPPPRPSASGGETRAQPMGPHRGPARGQRSAAGGPTAGLCPGEDRGGNRLLPVRSGG